MSNVLFLFFEYDFTMTEIDEYVMFGEYNVQLYSFKFTALQNSSENFFIYCINKFEVMKRIKIIFFLFRIFYYKERKI